MTTLRFALCMIFACSAAVCQGQSPLDASHGRSEDGVRWFDAKLLAIEGQGWSDTKSPFDRLPAKAEAKVRSAVWSLSQHSAGICVRFVTDAPAVHARWTLTSSRLAMPHMAATGVSGVDLYVKHEGDWR